MDTEDLTCLVRFRLITPDGAVLPGGTINFRLATGLPRPVGESTEVPKLRTATADAEGLGQIRLNPGTYKIQIRDADDIPYDTTHVQVPPEPEAVLALWQDEEPLPPAILSDVRDAVRDTAAAADRAERARDDLLNSSLLFVAETEIGVRMAVGQGVIVSESSNPYDSITLRIPA